MVADVKVAQHFLIRLIYLRILFLQKMKLLKSWDVFFIRGISHNKPRDFIQLMKSGPISPTGVKNVPVKGL